MDTKEIEIYNNIKNFLIDKGYKTQSIYGTYYFDLFKKDTKNKIEYCITFYHEEKSFSKSSRTYSKDCPYAIWEKEIIDMKDLKIINYIVKQLGWEE